MNEKERGSERVFGELAAMILRGNFPANSQLPGEQTLATRFGTSRILVRAAIHQLQEIGLVQCSQGARTIVKDIDEANDPRLIGLVYRFASHNSRDLLRDVVEKQSMQSVALLDIASRRADARAKAELLAAASEFAIGTRSEGEFDRFEEAFWSLVARAGGNRVLIAEVSYWYRQVPTQVRAAGSRTVPMPMRQGLYLELSRRLAANESVGDYYLALLRPWLTTLDEHLASEQEVAAQKNGTGSPGKTGRSRKKKPENVR